MQTMKRLSAIVLVLAMLLGLGACCAPEVSDLAPGQQLAKQDNVKEELSEKEPISSDLLGSKHGDFNPGVVLVKAEETFRAEDLGTLAYTSAQALYEGSRWYAVHLADETKTEEAYAYLTDLGNFEQVDYDYIMSTGANSEEAKVTDNPNYDQQTNLGLHNIPYGWTQNGKHPGGSSDVVIAVIDTGVDYTHLDLRNNIWTNAAEIPGNGKDDDGNGYIDDVHGWDFVGNDADPMDDNGHGTHVAGIIAAENNKVGGVGVAYGCTVMVLKAGNSSGYFNNSDIAEAIQYAYMNGASVINMSFGGSAISLAVEEALENAYNTCVLVAAAGNDGACNQPGCLIHVEAAPSYPAALSYVIGVMSTDANGQHISSFSNYDHYPYNSIEYEVFAVGEGVGSTWPGNKYACLNGTSMAAPTVAGIAALLRSYYADREVYSTKFIQSQIVNTGTLNPYNAFLEDTDSAHAVANIYEAMTQTPKPSVNLYDYYVEDSASISEANNGNGVIDAGETVRLYIALHNRGGVASDIKVTIDTIRNGDPGLTDPYFTFVNPTMQLSDIGTYSVRESGEKYFEIVVSSDCPNEYLADFNIRYTYSNGIDEKDASVYRGEGKSRLRIYKGVYLPREISSDLTLYNDKEYIVSCPVFINPGVTVTVKEGVKINLQDSNQARIVVAGTLIIDGSEDALVQLYAPIERWGDEASIILAYADLSARIEADIVDHCICKGTTEATVIRNSVLNTGASANSGRGQKINCVFPDPYACKGVYDKCVFYTGDSYATTLDSTLFAPGSINALLNFDDFAEPLKYNQHGFYYTDYYKRKLLAIVAPSYKAGLSKEENTYQMGAIYWGTSDKTKIESYIYDFYVDPKWGVIDDPVYLETPPEDVWPFVTNIRIINKDGKDVTTVSSEEVTFLVEFNRDMDTSVALSVKFGTIEPYADYAVTGEFINSRTWQGTYTLKSSFENGVQYINISNGRADSDHFMVLYEPAGRFTFNIDTTAAMSMNLQAVGTDDGIQLTFQQDDYDTLLGYNIYRSEDKDGNFVRLNPAILLPGESAFLDENAEPGKTYWYTYTVVLTDFTESAPAGKVQATAKDTMAPSLYHTPVNQGYENNNLVISCTASDNVAIQTVTLYYRTTGASEWKSLNMSRQNDKYSATIFGSEVTLAGIEYYIVAKDALNTVSKGSAETPYTVLVKSVDSLLGMGDVDGNGQISVKDALMLMQCLNGDLILADDAFRRADLNGDGKLSSAEALRILQYVNGKVSDLKM